VGEIVRPCGPARAKGLPDPTPMEAAADYALALRFFFSPYFMPSSLSPSGSRKKTA
jgi:hypothetical protein